MNIKIKTELVSLLLNQIKLITITLPCILLTCCALPNNISELSNPLDAAIKPVSHLGYDNLNIGSTYVAVGTSPHQLQSFMPGGSVNQAGLVGVLTELVLLNNTNSEIEEQKKLLHPVRSVIIDYNYSSKLRANIEEQLTRLKWLNVNYVGKYPNLQSDNVSVLLKNNSEDNLIVVDSGYFFSDKYNSLNVICLVAMHSKNKQNTDDHKLDYKNIEDTLVYQKKFNYSYTLGSDTQEPSAALNKWSENHGAKIIEAFNTALKTLSNNISVDLSLKKSAKQTAQLPL